MRRLTAVCTACLLAAVAAPNAGAASRVHSCKPVVNPYAGTRYEGVNLSHIKSRGVGCVTARKVARGAHAKALGMTPPPNGIRRFKWHGWSVTGDLRPASDKYVATRGGKHVRWRF